MRVKSIIEGNFQDYKKISLFIATIYCDGKCWRELNLPSTTCQNEEIMKEPTIEIDNKEIINRYLNNPFLKSIVFGGLEPIKQFDELKDFIKEFREVSNDDIVIYTGYYEDEIKKELIELEKYSNIIVKFGRYIPNRQSKCDEVLGVTLASDNQYARKIS